MKQRAFNFYLSLLLPPKKMLQHRYPLRHSTYFTKTDHISTSELPVSTVIVSKEHWMIITQKFYLIFFAKQPMNSTEDILQDTFMRRRLRQENIDTIPNIVSVKLKGHNNNFKKVLKKVVTFITVSRLRFFLLLIEFVSTVNYS